MLAAALVATLLWRTMPGEPTPAVPAPVEPPVAVAESPREVSTVAADEEPEEVRAVTEWARAWSDQRVEDYLSAYGAGFRPQGALDRSAWESSRRARILAPQWIEVGLAFIEVEPLDGGRRRVSFVQAYESDSYRDVVRKVLVLEHDGAGWKIVRESVEP